MKFNHRISLKFHSHHIFNAIKFSKVHFLVGLHAFLEDLKISSRYAVERNLLNVPPNPRQSPYHSNGKYRRPHEFSIPLEMKLLYFVFKLDFLFHTRSCIKRNRTTIEMDVHFLQTS